MLDAHAAARRAHLAGDADLLTQGMAEHVWEASHGGLNRLAREDIGERFANYFATVRYEIWDDLQPPHASISDDGTSAWMAVEIEARLTARADDGTDRAVAFESSWIATYEKRDGRWLMTSISSSVVERT